jgi:protein phosphatase 1 regulatory subunit 7
MAHYAFQGLQTLRKLQVLSLQSNRITKLEGLEELTELNQLYLSHNGIQRLDGLGNNVSSVADLISL